ncbi:MAG: hypothetical protein F6K19_35990 [Cyanothece sp. SIO1E1]|nr:hypothetical protein [Cyanothece sp. SIO1E1]
MKYEELFQELRKKYTVEEIATSMLIPADLSPEEKDKADQELREYRMRMLAEMTEEDRLLSGVMGLRIQMQDYLKQGIFSSDKSFGKYLGEYIRIINRSRKAISEEIAIHYTKLSRILNDKEEPNVELCYRLEKHSGNLIKAELWWKLIIKKQEYELAKDHETRKEEQDKVKNPIRA